MWTGSSLSPAQRAATRSVFDCLRKRRDLTRSRQDKRRPLTVGVLTGTPTDIRVAQRPLLPGGEGGSRVPLPDPTCRGTGHGLWRNLYWPRRTRQRVERCAAPRALAVRLLCDCADAEANAELAPDMLFTTTAMLNRNISTLEMQRVSGIGVAKSHADAARRIPPTRNNGRSGRHDDRQWHTSRARCASSVFRRPSPTLCSFQRSQGFEDSLVTSTSRPRQLEYEGAESMVACERPHKCGQRSFNDYQRLCSSHGHRRPSVHASEGLYDKSIQLPMTWMSPTVYLLICRREGQRHSAASQTGQATARIMLLPIDGDIAAQRRAGQSLGPARSTWSPVPERWADCEPTTSQDAGWTRHPSGRGNCFPRSRFDDPAVGAAFSTRPPACCAFLQRKGGLVAAPDAPERSGNMS